MLLNILRMFVACGFVLTRIGQVRASRS